MNFKDLAEKRYSCKKYSSREVEKDVLENILETARLAPTAKNQQIQHIYVLQSPDALAKVDDATPCRYGAPVVLAVTYDKENQYVYPDGIRKSGVEDAAIVATHLMLAAADNGVDSCWVNCFYPDRLHESLGLPANEDILMLLDLGYAAPGAGPLPNHTSRKPLSDTVTFL